MYIRLREVELRLDLSESTVDDLIQKIKGLSTITKVETIRCMEYIKQDNRYKQVDLLIRGDKLDIDEILEYLNPFITYRELE